IVAAAGRQAVDLEGEHRARLEAHPTLCREEARTRAGGQPGAAGDGRGADDAGAAEGAAVVDDDGALRLRTVDQQDAAVDRGRTGVGILAPERLGAAADLGEGPAR